MALGSPQAGQMFLANVDCVRHSSESGGMGEYLKRRDLINVHVALKGYGSSEVGRGLGTAPCWGSVLGAVTSDRDSMTRNLKETLNAWRRCRNGAQSGRSREGGRENTEREGGTWVATWWREEEAVASIKCQPKSINHGIRPWTRARFRSFVSICIFQTFALFS
ncbi:hypothetical protein B0H16DRAFT_1509185 [Mycena metata]|uniref:Uncharacterized protein n=1 Tax=Mycena metata TaxID=1033252 RepID=A0AAD7K1A9_9AGAR|nr:hypothetical protein B0H16DRAFT_1509185 [Mycena metata]